MTFFEINFIFSLHENANLVAAFDRQKVRKTAIK
jgi:hypothetical protein